MKKLAENTTAGEDLRWGGYWVRRLAIFGVCMDIILYAKQHGIPFDDEHDIGAIMRENTDFLHDWGHEEFALIFAAVFWIGVALSGAGHVLQATSNQKQ